MKNWKLTFSLPSHPANFDFFFYLHMACHMELNRIHGVLNQEVLVSSLWNLDGKKSRHFSVTTRRKPTPITTLFFYWIFCWFSVLFWDMSTISLWTDTGAQSPTKLFFPPWCGQLSVVSPSGMVAHDFWSQKFAPVTNSNLHKSELLVPNYFFFFAQQHEVIWPISRFYASVGVKQSLLRYVGEQTAVFWKNDTWLTSLNLGASANIFGPTQKFSLSFMQFASEEVSMFALQSFLWTFTVNWWW